MDIELSRTTGESRMKDSKQKKFTNGYKGALRFATYIEDYHTRDSYSHYIKNVTPEDFEDMQNYYVQDYLLRPHSGVFKDTIGNLTNVNYLTSERVKKILKSIAYNDVINFLDFIKNKKNLRKHYIRLMEEE